jgi:spermidine synthase
VAPAAVLLGAAFPLAVAASVRSSASVGRDAGHVLGWNTAGAVLGALSAGVLLVPWIGAERTVLAAAAVNVSVAIALWWGARARVRLALSSGAVAALAVVVALAPRWDPDVLLSAPTVYARQYLSGRDPAGALRKRVRSRAVLFYEEGAGSTVAVVQDSEGRALLVNGKADASDGQDMQTQVLLGHLPALLHGAPERAFVIGLGSGVTAASLAQHGLREVLVAELEPAVVSAAAFFRHVNEGVLSDPRVRVVIGDGRRLLAAASGHFDVITSEPSNPWIAGQGDLFTREFYEIARGKLADGGVMVQWIHGYSMSPGDLRTVAATFLAVFPRASLWRGGRGDYLLVGGDAVALPGSAALADRVAEHPRVRASLARFLLDADELPRARVLHDDELRSYAAGAPLNTDEHPRLEFSAPLALHRVTMEENERALRAHRRAPPPMPADPRERLEAARRMIVRGALEDAAEELALLPPASLDPGLRFERARLLVDLGRPRDAALDLLALTRERPHDPAPAALLREAVAADPPRGGGSPPVR